MMYKNRLSKTDRQKIINLVYDGVMKKYKLFNGVSCFYTKVRRAPPTFHQLYSHIFDYVQERSPVRMDAPHLVFMGLDFMHALYGHFICYEIPHLIDESYYEPDHLLIIYWLSIFDCFYRPKLIGPPISPGTDD